MSIASSASGMMAPNNTHQGTITMNKTTDTMDPISMELGVDAYMYLIFCVVGVIANALVIASIVKTYRLRHSGFYTCVLILACVDILYLLNVPISAIELATYRSWRAGIVMCKLYILAFTYGVYTKKLLLLAIAGIHIHRLRLMSSTGFTITRRNALIVGLILCVSIFMVTLPAGAFAQLYPISKHHTYCSPNHASSHRFYMFFLLGLASLFEVSIVVTTVVLSVYFCLRRQALKASDGDGKLSAMLIIQLMMELLTTTLLIALSRIYGMFVVMIYFPSLVRPGLYLVFCPLLRRTFKRFVTCGGLCANEDEGKDDTLLVAAEEVDE